MGKTSFVLNYYARNQQLPPHQRHRLAVIPLGIKDALKKISDIENKAETILFLDAFDEDTQAIPDHRIRLGELMEACQEFKRVLITCRTQFFPSDEEIPISTGIIKVGVTGAGESKEYEFWKMYLLPLTDEQVDQFLRLRYSVWQPGARQQAREVVAKIPRLSVRPMLLSYIPDLLGSDFNIQYSYQLYEIMVEQWIKRENHWVDSAALREFSERLAVKLHSERQDRRSERIAHTELQDLASQWGVRLEGWQLRGRSLLNRDAEGNYKFAHRTIMEYLALKRFIQGERPAYRLSLTDQMNAFLQDMLVSNTDLHGSYLMGADLKGARLKGANLEDADLEAANLQGADLEEANLKQANLVRSNLQEAKLKGADLEGAILPWDGLKNATYDSRTRWPDRLDHLSPGVFEWDTNLPTEWTNNLGMMFVQIPSGTFLMGASESTTEATESENSQHAVWLPQPFYLGKYPVTQGQWEAVMGNNPSGFTGDPDRPVEQVSWEEVQRFLKTLNKLEKGTGYCLPTEAQWEYACRAGSKGEYYFGDDGNRLRDYAWYSDNSSGQTLPVGQKPANPWGLHDMYGNVWEWVEDWHGAYSNDAQVNPSGPESGSYRVFRGGSWYDVAEDCRSSTRGSGGPGNRLRFLGFRLARTV